jgi:hypothetical protein
MVLWEKRFGFNLRLCSVAFTQVLMSDGERGKKDNLFIEQAIHGIISQRKSKPETRRE